MAIVRPGVSSPTSTPTRTFSKLVSIRRRIRAWPIASCSLVRRRLAWRRSTTMTPRTIGSVIQFEILTGVGEVFVSSTTTETANISLPTNAPTELTIDDDETQRYALALARGQTPTEGTSFTVNLTASPASCKWQWVATGEPRQAVGLDAHRRRRGKWQWSHPCRFQRSQRQRGPSPSRQNDGDSNRGDRHRDRCRRILGVAGASVEQASLSIDVADGDALQAVTAKMGRRGRDGSRSAAHVGHGRRIRQDCGHADRQGRARSRRPTRLSRSRWRSTGSADARGLSRWSAPVDHHFGPER